MKEVLIALDYNPSAEKVAEIGYEFAKAMNASVTLLHVKAEPLYYYASEYTPIMGYAGLSSTEMTELLSANKITSEAEDFLESSREHLNDNSIKIIVGEGDSADCILKTANNIGASFIVMGSHCRKGLEKLLMGSLAEKVLHNTMIPLFIIPTRDEKIKHH
ncbi:MAG: universal stress protein [Bacteroidota bacterium]